MLVIYGKTKSAKIAVDQDLKKNQFMHTKLSCLRDSIEYTGLVQATWEILEVV